MEAEWLNQIRGLARVLLAAEEFDGQSELQAQVDGLRVVGGPVTMLGLAVTPKALRSAFSGSQVPGTAWVRDDSGRVIGTLVLWVEDGYLSALEYAWVTDEPPTRLPDPEQVWFESA